ncbi:hypothetical protein ACMDCR_01825 [Labrys okinawensis]|uniref:hypothetical protein n=1 Tax=Labrys okinawensis TaxID=346911 RepID=UPI0039BD0C39
MGDAKKKIYDYLIEGATSGLTDDALYSFIVKKVPKANSKRIARAGFLALSDPTLTDRTVLNVIYALAIKHRLGGDALEEEGEGGDSSTEMAETTSSPAEGSATTERKRKK